MEARRTTAALLLLPLLSLGCSMAIQQKTWLVPESSKGAMSKMVLALQDLGFAIQTVDEKTGIITAEWQITWSQKKVNVSVVILESTESATRLRVNVTEPGAIVSDWAKRRHNELLAKFKEYAPEVEVLEANQK